MSLPPRSPMPRTRGWKLHLPMCEPVKLDRCLPICGTLTTADRAAASATDTRTTPLTPSSRNSTHLMNSPKLSTTNQATAALNERLGNVWSEFGRFCEATQLRRDQALFAVTGGYARATQLRSDAALRGVSAGANLWHVTRHGGASRGLTWGERRGLAGGGSSV